MSRVLVTGASGFIGRHTLAPLVDLGFEVHAVARRAPTRVLEGVVWHEIDLLNTHARAAVVREAAASHLLHLAWYAEPGSFWTAIENARWVGATVELVELFAAAGGGRAVLAGTCAEYDWSRNSPLVEGETPIAPSTLYGVCKDATRRVVEALVERLGLSFGWGRIFFLYGPGEHPDRLVSSVARALVRNERAATSGGTQVRDFLHVEDVAVAFTALLSSEVTGAVNIGSGRGVAVREIVESIARAAGHPELLDVGALPSRPGDPAQLVADVGRLHDEVGFRPRIALGDGLATTVEFWRNVTPSDKRQSPLR